MPIMDGIQTTIQIKKLVNEKVLKKIPIFALTANTEDSTHKKCIEVGMIGVFGKPLKKDSLLEVLKR